MKSVKYLLIGGGLASQRAAAKIREIDPAGSILMVARENRLPYDRPPLSKEFMQGKTPADKIPLAPERFYREKAIEVMLGRSVDRLDPSAHTATLAGGETVRFEKTLLATGGRPVPLAVPGANLPGVFYLRTLDDAEAISAQAQAGRRATIIGGGFIGIELASSLTQRGVKVTLLERGDRIWRRFADEQLAGYIQDFCAARGVTFLRRQQVAGIRGSDGGALSVATVSGMELPCDFVCVAVGIELNIELAEQAGLKIDGGIVVNDRLQTSHPDVYAAGDVISFPDAYSGRRRRVEHWGGADTGGAVAGENMAVSSKGLAASGLRTYDALTYVWSDLFDLHLEFAGDESAPEKVLMRGGLADKSFAILYLKAGRLTAYYAINYKKKQYVPLQNVIKSGMDLNGREGQLQDPGFDVSSLLTPQGVK